MDKHRYIKHCTGN